MGEERGTRSARAWQMGDMIYIRAVWWCHTGLVVQQTHLLTLAACHVALHNAALLRSPLQAQHCMSSTHQPCAPLQTTRRLVLSPASASTAGPSVTLPPLLVNVARILLSKLQVGHPLAVTG
jgi:hypothetical protein